MRVKDVLSEHNYNIRGKYISVLKCQCGSHKQTRFIVEIDSKELPVEIISELETISKPFVKFTNIITR